MKRSRDLIVMRDEGTNQCIPLDIYRGDDGHR